MLEIRVPFRLNFPIAIVFAWAFEMTPDGLKKETDINRNQSRNQRTGRKLNYAIITLLVVSLSYFVWESRFQNDRLISAPQSDTGPPTAAGVQPTENEARPDPSVEPEQKSIAVLPFQNRSANEENAAFFADGIHDELLTNLSGIKALKVISRTSVMNYRDTTKNLRQVGKELGVATILEGGVQRAGDRVRIMVQLIDAKTDRNLWAQTYDRQLTATNLFIIQSEISLAIADELRANLLPIEQKRLASIPTENLAALEAYFLGKQSAAKRTSVALAKAVEYFHRAIELDPDFALAYVGLADSYTLQDDYGNLSKKEAFALAEPQIKKALERNPGRAATMAWMGLLYLDLGDQAEAEYWIKQALETAPDGLYANWAMEMLLLFHGELARAKEYAEKVLWQDPVWALSLANLASQELRTGFAANASARYENQFPQLFAVDEPSIDRSNIDAAINLGLISTSLEQPARAALLLDRSLDFAESTSIPRLHWFPIVYGIPQQVQIYALQGKTGKALAALRQAIDGGWRSLWWYWLEVDPSIESIRGEADFQAMVDEIKLDMAAQLARVRKKQQQ